MGQDCKYCGAYIAGNTDRCPACGKKIKPADRRSGFGYASAVAEEREEMDQREERQEEAREESRAYTYKDEYNRRYGSNDSWNAAEQESGGYRDTVGNSGAQCAHGQAAGRYSFTDDADDDVKQNKAISYLCYFGLFFLIPYLTRPNSDFVKFHSNQGLVMFITSCIVNAFGWPVRILGGLFVLGCFVIGLSNVSKGEKKPLPFIGKFSLLK